MANKVCERCNMSTPMDHIAYLSQEIGPRPAGTEEEQQAALYITERLQKDAHLSAQIEDFTCNSNALMTPIICYGVAIVAVLLGIILPVIAIPAGVLALAAAAVAISEALDRPLLSQAFTKGVSQNIVAKYEPTQSSDAAGSRRRKVIVVANYDSGKVRRETAGVFVRALRPLRYGALGGMVVAAVFTLLRGVVLSEGAASLVFAVLAGVCLIPSAVLLVFALLEKFGPFTEAANDNASGVAVMLEVARRLGNGEVSADAPIAAGEDVSFVSEKREPSSISDNLVQLKDGPIVADTAQQRKETMAALTGAPEGPLAEVAAKAAELNEKHAQEEAAADARAAYEERVRARHEAEAAAAEAARIARWMSREYVATLSECLRLFLPPGGSPRVVKGDDGAWSVERPAVKPIQNRWVMLTPEGFDYTPPKTAVRQRQLIEALQCGPVTTRDLNLLYNSMSATIKALEKRGVVVVEERRAWRGCSEQTTLSSASGKAPVALTNGQQQALAQIERARLDAHGDVVLVDGVTGSGKTFIGLTFKRKRCTFFPTVAFAKSNR